jgi:hypothetical protein
MTSLYWFGPPESKTLRPVGGVVLQAWWIYIGGHPWSPYIGWQTRSVDQSLGRLRPGNLSLVSYNIISCDLRTDWRRGRRLGVHAKSCSCIGLGLLEESSGMSSGHGSSLLGPLSGWQVFCWAGPACRDGREPSRWGHRGTHVSQLDFEKK